MFVGVWGNIIGGVLAVFEESLGILNGLLVFTFCLEFCPGFLVQTSFGGQTSLFEGFLILFSYERSKEPCCL